MKLFVKWSLESLFSWIEKRCQISPDFTLEVLQVAVLQYAEDQGEDNDKKREENRYIRARFGLNGTDPWSCRYETLKILPWGKKLITHLCKKFPDKVVRYSEIELAQSRLERERATAQAFLDDLPLIRKNLEKKRKEAVRVLRG